MRCWNEKCNNKLVQERVLSHCEARLNQKCFRKNYYYDAAKGKCEYCANEEDYDTVLQKCIVKSTTVWKFQNCPEGFYSSSHLNGGCVPVPECPEG